MFTTVVAPIVSLLNSLMAPLLAIVGALGALYCVVLGALRFKPAHGSALWNSSDCQGDWRFERYGKSI